LKTFQQKSHCLWRISCFSTSHRNCSSKRERNSGYWWRWHSGLFEILFFDINKRENGWVGKQTHKEAEGPDHRQNPLGMADTREIETHFYSDTRGQRIW